MTASIIETIMQPYKVQMEETLKRQMDVAESIEKKIKIHTETATASGTSTSPTRKTEKPRLRGSAFTGTRRQEKLSDLENTMSESDIFSADDECLFGDTPASDTEYPVSALLRLLSSYASNATKHSSSNRFQEVLICFW